MPRPDSKGSCAPDSQQTSGLQNASLRLASPERHLHDGEREKQKMKPILSGRFAYILRRGYERLGPPLQGIAEDVGAMHVVIDRSEVSTGVQNIGAMDPQVAQLEFLDQFGIILGDLSVPSLLRQSMEYNGGLKMKLLR